MSCQCDVMCDLVVLQIVVLFVPYVAWMQLHPLRGVPHPDVTEICTELHIISQADTTYHNTYQYHYQY